MAKYIIRKEMGLNGKVYVALQRAKSFQRAVSEKNQSNGLVFSRAISVSPANTTPSPLRVKERGVKFRVLGVNFGEEKRQRRVGCLFYGEIITSVVSLGHRTSRPDFLEHHSIIAEGTRGHIQL
jgi:hypothetical protein